MSDLEKMAREWALEMNAGIHGAERVKVALKYLERATESLRSELEQEKKWKVEDPRMLREQCRVGDAAFQLQRRNYIELCEAVLGDGSTTSEVKDICAIAKAQREQLAEARRDKERLDWWNNNKATASWTSHYNSSGEQIVSCVVNFTSGKDIRSTIDAAISAHETKEAKP